MRAKLARRPRAASPRLVGDGAYRIIDGLCLFGEMDERRQRHLSGLFPADPIGHQGGRARGRTNPARHTRERDGRVYPGSRLAGYEARGDDYFYGF